MSLNRSALKRRAVEIMSGSKPRVMLVGLVYLALAAVLEGLGSRVMSVNISESEAMNYLHYAMEGNYDYAMKYLDSMQPPMSAYAINLMLTVVMSVVTAGFLIFLLNTVRGSNPGYGNLLDGFGSFLRIVLLNLLMAVFIFLWSLLLVVPGIIAWYRYSQAIYILLDNPDKSPLQCIRESKARMKGHKGELFLLDLSFLGWYILGRFPIFGYAVRVWTTPYIATVKTLFYERLLGKDVYSYATGMPM